MIEMLRHADEFIVGSPEYFGTARGDVMAALQRIGMVSMASDRFLSWKMGGPIAVARRGGHTVTLQEMLMFFFINEMIVPGSNYWNMVFGREVGEVWQDQEGIGTIRLFARIIARLIDKISRCKLLRQDRRIR
jgi:multimeric flavodoxin WrbA